VLKYLKIVIKLDFVFMIVIRFSRVGRKNKPQFRIVVQKNSATPTGRHIEILGSWDPAQKKGVFKNERIQYWLSTGAQASDSVHNLLVSQKVIEAKKRAIKMKKVEVAKTEEAATAPVAKEETPAETPAPAVKEEAPAKEEVKAE